MNSDEYADEDYRAPSYKELLWGMRWYLYLPLCLFCGIGTAVNIGLLIHMHVVEIGVYGQFPLVENRWVYYANTGVYAAFFAAFAWLISNDAPDVMEIHR